MSRSCAAARRSIGIRPRKRLRFTRLVWTRKGLARAVLLVWFVSFVIVV